jgi:hypothetical protein
MNMLEAVRYAGVSNIVIKALTEEQDAGGFDDRESFADDPKAWEVKRA